MADGTGWLGQDHRRAPDAITVVRQDRAITAGYGQPPDPASRARPRMLLVGRMSLARGPELVCAQ